ncbi:MAG: hypothetical protein IPG22_22705 [Acidobacteria bacterium]|nr:hypothetical protein [Acidobacteriota bacterium]
MTRRRSGHPQVGTQVMKFAAECRCWSMTAFPECTECAKFYRCSTRIRGVGPDQALGGKADLPPDAHRSSPGHPMVAGQQSMEFDLNSVEQAKTVVAGV